MPSLVLTRMRLSWRVSLRALPCRLSGVTGALTWSGWSAYVAAVRADREPALLLRSDDLERQRVLGQDPETATRAAEQLLAAKQAARSLEDRLAELQRLDTPELQRRLAQLRLAPKHLDFNAEKEELKRLLWQRGEPETRR